MHITYHVNVQLDMNATYFPHSCLAKEIQDFIEGRNVRAKEYLLVKSNGYYLFIYLLNGDRIDVEL